MIKDEIRKTYIVKEKIVETPNISTLKLKLENETVPSYCSGQFITIYFPELGTPEGKAYSISSAPFEKTINITVKSIGLFSNKLCSMEPGDSFSASLPYGYFFSESGSSRLIMIAGGIGVAPFRGMILNSLKYTPLRKITLFQSSRTNEDTIFKKEFNVLVKKYDVFKVIYFLTREESYDPADFNRRMKASDIVGGNNHVKEKEFFLCGSIPFVRDIWKGLREKGVPEEMIYTEAFFSH